MITCLARSTLAVVLTALLLAWTPSDTWASEGYVAYDGMLQKWGYDSVTATYSLVGNPVSAVNAGLIDGSSENHRVLELEMNPRTGEIYTQSSDNILRRWSFDGTNFSLLGQVGNDGGRGLAFGDDNSVYALNGPGFLPALDPTGLFTPGSEDNTPISLGGSSNLLLKFPRDLSGSLYTFSVDGNDIVSTGGGDIYVASNDGGDGQIYHIQDTGSSFSLDGAGTAFWAGVLAVDPSTGDYAAAHGLNKSTGLHIPRSNAFPEEGGGGPTAPAWIISGDAATIGAGTIDGGTGTGIDYINDMEIGPDGTIFATHGPKISSTSGWVMAWGNNGPSQQPNLKSFVGNSDSHAAWLTVDDDGIIHTASNDGSNHVLRAWSWDGATLSLVPTAGFFMPPGATDMEEIALIRTVVSEGLTGDYNGNDVIDAADYVVWRAALANGSMSLTNDPTPGTVDDSDYNYWREHFGETLGGGIGSDAGVVEAVPEPSAVTSVLVGFGALVLFARRKGNTGRQGKPNLAQA
jgi:hypothetical protein